MDEPLLAFYGDDFTGSTDALEGLALNGVRAMLFLDPPTSAELAAVGDLDAVGVAGRSRSMSPEQMDETLPDVFRALGDLEPEMIHYKVCSTFDSAPDVGSIGRAIDVAQSTLDSPFVPVSQASTVPAGRYVAFGNLFAAEGDDVYRIDRHPTMRDHPTTPMRESDLRRHLGEQTDRDIGLVDLRQLERGAVSLPESEVVVFDAIAPRHLHTIGEFLWDRATAADGPLFAVGSSGLEHHALTTRWAETGAIPDTDSLLEPHPPVEQVAVVSGSASPVTDRQIQRAADDGFATLRLDAPRLVDPDEAAAAREDALDAALAAVEDGRSVVLYTARGPDDPAIERTRERYAALDCDESMGARLGREQGRVFRALIAESGLERVCVAGGDTSGYVVPQLDAYALEPVAPTAPGAPLCRIHSHTDVFDGIEITLKGGQTGGENYFEALRAGGVDPE
ncbi:MAG: four-carbon acid sugar kinase family protein [Halobacteriaceae archaeon]